MSRVTKALKLLNYLSFREVVSLQELSDYLELSERSVQRLRLSLEDAGYRIETIKGPGGGYKLDKSTTIAPMDFTLKQKHQLKQSLPVLADQQKDTFGDTFIEALGVLSSQLDYHQVPNILSFQTVRMNIDAERYQKHMSILEQSIDNHMRVEIKYRKNYREQRHYLFEPYSLVIVNNMWYVSGYDQKDRYLNLKITRIKEIIELNVKFRYDENTLKIKGINEFGYNINPVSAEIIVRNMDYISEYIWGDKQSIEWIDDHSFYLQVIFPNELAFKKFILSGGSNITIIKPESQRLWIKEEANKILKNYT